ncbi:hypothetical protein [Streptomyces sp. NPDC001275]
MLIPEPDKVRRPGEDAGQQASYPTMQPAVAGRQHPGEILQIS